VVHQQVWCCSNRHLCERPHPQNSLCIMTRQPFHRWAKPHRATVSLITRTSWNLSNSEGSSTERQSLEHRLIKSNLQNSTDFHLKSVKKSAYTRDGLTFRERENRDIKQKASCKEFLYSILPADILKYLLSNFILASAHIGQIPLGQQSKLLCVQNPIGERKVFIWALKNLPVSKKKKEGQNSQVLVLVIRNE